MFYTKLLSAVFELLIEKVGSDVMELGQSLVDLGVDKLYDGFWVLDNVNNIEFYSPKFRQSLGFEGENDFPSVPASWQKQIDPESLALSTLILEEHIHTKSETPYYIDCIYNTKEGKLLKLICQGDMIYYGDDGQPTIMFGVHKIKPIS